METLQKKIHHNPGGLRFSDPSCTLQSKAVYVSQNQYTPTHYTLARAQRDGISSQTIHSKVTAYNITTYQTFQI